MQKHTIKADFLTLCTKNFKDSYRIYAIPAAKKSGFRNTHKATSIKQVKHY